MTAPRMRPSFTLPLRAPERMLPALEETLLSEEERRCEGTFFRRHAVLTIEEAHRHFWSPYLYLEIREGEEEDEEEDLAAPHLYGRFAPHPHLWSLFMAVYGLLAIAAIASAVWGFSVWTLGEPPWALLGVPAAVGLFAFTYGAAFIGQGLGAAQMYELRRVVDRAWERCEEGEG